MKKYLISIIFILLLSGCSYKIIKIEQGDNKVISQENQLKNTETDIFNKKQECQRYLPELNEKYKDYELSTVVINYSLKLNSCIGEIIVYNKIDKSTSYIIDDILKGEQLFSRRHFVDSGIADDHQALQEFKNELEKIK